MAQLKSGSTVGGEQIETTMGAQAKIDIAENNLSMYIDNLTGGYEIQKNGSDGSGIINFKT